MKEDLQKEHTHMVYDDGCHEKPYTVNRKHLHKNIKYLSEKKWRVDDMHIRGHVEECQRSEYNPQKDELMKCVNSQVCEQENRWLNKYRHMNRHQDEKCEIFMIYMCHLHNIRLCEIEHK